MPSYQTKNQINLESEASFFAAFLNLARHNAFLTVTEICKRLGKGELHSDDQLFTPSIFDSLNEVEAKNQPNQAQKTMRLLYRHFPFLESVEREMVFINNRKLGKKDDGEEHVNLKEQKLEPQEWREFFKTLFATLNGFRNYASHPKQDKPIFSNDLIRCMKQIYDAAKRRTKARMKYEEDDVKHLDRWAIVKLENGEKTTKEKERFDYKLDDSEGNLTTLGLAFFICFFLDKKQSHLFLNQFSQFKILAEKESDSETLIKERKKAVAAFEVFTDYRMRIPSLRIESEASVSQLFMDMLGELKRCPTELFDQISKEDQDRFWVEPKDEEVEKALKMNRFENEAEEDDEILLLRHDDRFAGLAMRFLDESFVFLNLRFMIDLGNYHHKIYEKKIGGEWQMRRLTQKLLTFGRLQEFSLDKLRNKYGTLVKDPAKIDSMEKEPYISETHPHYHYFEDNIAVKFTSTNFETWPSLESSKKSQKPDRKAYQPDFFISRDELFSIALYATLTKPVASIKKGEFEASFSETEKVLMAYKQRMTQFFKAVGDGSFSALNDTEFPVLLKDSNKNETLRRKEILQAILNEKRPGILTAHIPDDLLDYLINTTKKPINVAASEKLTRMIEQTQSRLRRLEKDLERDKIGKANHKDVKKGTLGTFLAKDMMMFQPATDTEGKGKATGLVFQTLQASIAFYMRDRTMLRRLFKECGLIDSANPHPFLGQMRAFDQMHGIIDFYRTYLEARQLYLGNELKKCHKEGISYVSPHWLKMNRQKDRATRDYGQKLAAKYLDLPMNLARGLFLDPIKEWMLKNGNETLRNLIASADRTNSAFLLRLYFEHQLNDHQQDFYESARWYKIFEHFYVSKNGEMNDGPYYKTSEMNDALLDEVKGWIQSLPETIPEPSRSNSFHRRIEEKPTLTRAGAKKSLTFYQKNERRLRQIKAQDMALFLMAKDLLRMSGDNDTWQGNLNKLKLKDIIPDAERGPLSEFISYELKLQYSEMLNGLKKPDGKTIDRTIFQTRIKVKNYGDFRRFLKDRRLNNLMFYFDDAMVDRIHIEREIDEYDRNRIKIFELVRAFEDKVVKRWPEMAKLRPAKGEPSLHQQILDKYFSAQPLHKNQAERMRNLRNSYFHNEFPDFALFPELRHMEDKSLSARILKIAQNTYGEFTKSL